MATTDTNPNRDIILSKDQIEKIIAGLKLLPPEPDAPGFDTATPHELIELFEEARDGDADGCYDFTS